jgi:hypothetical protein
MAVHVKTLQPLLYLNNNLMPIHSLNIVHQLLSKLILDSIMQDRHGGEAQEREQKLRKGMQMAIIKIRVGCVEFYLINGGKRYVHGERIWTEDMMIRKMEVRLVARIRLNEVRPGYNCTR